MRRLFLLLLLTLITIWLSHAIEESCRRVCGRKRLAPSHGISSQSRAGADTLTRAWPWMVSIRTPFRSRFQHTCGGSLISNSWILTAAHCFNETSYLTNWELVFGASQLSQTGPNSQVRFPKRMVKHEDYQPQEEINDIALIELDDPVHCNSHIQPACLPDGSVDVPAMTHCYIAGWGYTEEKSQAPSETLKQARVDLIPTKTCNSSNWYHGSIRANTLCAGFEGGGIDTCQGDSGGPLMCREDRTERFWVVGITGWGRGCARVRRPGVYTSTQPFYDWIQGYLNGESIPPTTTPPLPRTEAHPSTETQATSEETPQPPPLKPRPLTSLRYPPLATQEEPTESTPTSPPQQALQPEVQTGHETSAPKEATTPQDATKPTPRPTTSPPPRRKPPRRKTYMVVSSGYASSWDHKRPRLVSGTRSDPQS